eukprot:GHVR01190357.1.p3 GENE.GHVR01190357.1~~GHVR01190357.1.p3  ORF type:complete len:123 (-),score=23.23 GHVR01190357.1:725-1093(-)
MGLSDGEAWERDYYGSNPPKVVATKSQADIDSEDAAKWRALMSSARIRVMGFTNDLNHAGFEFWRDHTAKHPSAEYPQDMCRARLEEYVARLIADRAVCPICDGGPGNSGACSCPTEWKVKK